MSNEAKTERTLARIKKASLFIEDPGILTSYLNLEYAEPERKIGEQGQSFGGYWLCGEYAFRWINGVMKCLGVEDWSKVAGKYVFAEHEHTKVHRIIGVDTGLTFDPTLWKDEHQ